MLTNIFFGFLLSNSFLIAQTLVGAGYAAPAPVSVGPGQIATFYVAGLSSLTGITATLQQGGSISIPIQAVSSVSLCPSGRIVSSVCGSLAAITVQIPYELNLAGPAAVQISQSGEAGTAIEVNPVADQVHVLTACDVAIGQSSPQPNLTGLPCTPLVTHSNGSLASASSPATVGEALTAWVFGLGQTTPAATTGQPASAAPTAETFFLNFNYQVNALPAKPYAGDPDVQPPQPLYAGLAPGFVGLYQVNFIVPSAPANGIAQCAPSVTPTTIATTGPQSNLTVSIGGQFSFDGAGICVATQIPVD
jgi:uncharacterized protein (TIGR03437 family)